MYDTTTLCLGEMNAEASMSKLTNPIAIINRYTGERGCSGNLRNLRVKVWLRSIWLTGSLAKFHLGSNIETLSREETPRAIERLSDELQQPMAEARVYRVDVAQTFEMERPPADYWRCFLTPTRMMRVEVPEKCLTFRNDQRAIVFYDKLAEMRRRRACSEDRADKGGASRITGNPNLLRYEVQFKRRLARAFGEKGITAASLSNPAFYEKVVGRWEAEYFKLERISSFLRPVRGSTVRPIMNYFAVMGLYVYGPQRAFDDVVADQHAGLIDKSQAQRRRTKIRELLRVGRTMAAGDVLEEFDAKVRQALALSTDSARVALGSTR
jgi:hypothetical protein